MTVYDYVVVVFYLAFMLTFPPVVMNSLNFALKELAVNASVHAAQAVGVTLRRDGMQLFFTTGELRVENPCSGLRSLLALLATGTLFAYFQHGGAWRRGAVMLAAIPIALVGNIARLWLLLVAADRRGVVWATGHFHDVTVQGLDAGRGRESNLPALLRGQIFDVGAERRDQSEIVQTRRPQFPGEPVNGVHGICHQSLGARDPCLQGVHAQGSPLL